MKDAASGGLRRVADREWLSAGNVSSHRVGEVRYGTSGGSHSGHLPARSLCLCKATVRNLVTQDEFTLPEGLVTQDGFPHSQRAGRGWRWCGARRGKAPPREVLVL